MDQPSLAVPGTVSLFFSRSGALAVVTLICAVLYIAAFATSWGPLVWVMLAEISP